MSPTNPDEAQAKLRDEIIIELWALVADDDCAGSAKVAALKEIARLEGVDKPASKKKDARFQSLADFYGDDDEEEEEEEEADE